MITAERALELVLDHVPPPRAEECSLDDAVGRVLAENLEAPEDIPPFDRAMMDGFAVSISDAGRSVDVIDEIAAGSESRRPIEPGRSAEIMTGAPCPLGTEAVVPVEKTHREGGRLHLPESIQRGRHVQPRGSIRAAGATTAKQGETISSLVVANLAAFGQKSVRVWARPDLAVITTGDELIAPESTRRGAAIRDSNGPMLAAMARAAGAGRVTVLHATDNEASLASALVAAAKADIVVLTGGVSMGRYDLVPAAATVAGFEAVFHKVSQKPGKPILFAQDSGRLLFGLPGNPRSSHFCFHRYVASTLRAATGRVAGPQSFAGALSTSLTATSKRTLWVPMRAEIDSSGTARLEPFDERGSADIFSTTRANAYARVEPGHHIFELGSMLPFEWTCDAFI